MGFGKTWDPGGYVLAFFQECEFIISTYHTWRSRHGPAAQESWRIKKKNWSQQRATREFRVLDERWPQNLKGCITNVIADEAQYIKSVKVHSHTDVKWLDTFTISSTATPDVNSVRDFEGYIDLIEPSATTLQEQVCDVEDIDVDCNPYTDLEKHSIAGRLLRCTSNNVKRFVIDNDDPIVAGSYIATLYGDCMIRRSNVSRVDGKMIGDEIPALKHRRQMCHWLKDAATGTDELKEYESQLKQHVRALVRVDEAGNVTWNWKHYRMLLLLCTWTGFVYLEEHMTAESTEAIIKKGEGALDWIVQKYCDAVREAMPEDLPSKLAVLRPKSPKVCVKEDAEGAKL